MTRSLSVVFLVVTACSACTDGRSISKADRPTFPATAIAPAADSSLSDEPVHALSLVDSLVALGESAYSRGEWDSAQQSWRIALRHFRNSGDVAGEARVLTSLGLSAWRLGDYSRARTLGERALALKLDRDLKQDWFKSYNALGLLAWNQGRLDDARDHFDKAAAAARAEGDEESLAKVANNAGLIQIELGDFDAARKGFEEAVRIGHRLSNEMIEGRARNNLGMLAVRIGDPGSAVSELARARLLYRLAADATGEQNALGQLGAAYDAMGEPGLALAAMDTALSLSRDQGLRAEEASNLELIAGVHNYAGRPQHALKLYGEANLINAELDLEVERGTNLRKTAEIHADLGMRVVARESALRALELHRGSGARLEELRDLLLLARLDSEKGIRLASRTNYLSQAEDIARSLGARVARVEVALTRASLAEQAGKFREVLRILDRSAGDLESGGYGNEWIAKGMVARAYRGLSMLDSAAASGRIAIRAVERVRGNFRSGFLRTSFGSDRTELYADLVNALLKLGRIGEAFQIVDAARNRALVENLASAGAGVAASEASAVQALGEGESILRRIDALVSRVDAMEELPRSERDAESRARARSVTLELAAARSAYEAYMIRVAEGDASDFGLLGTNGATASDVQRTLSNDEAVIEYLVASEQLYTFVLTRRTITHVVSDVRSKDLMRRVRMTRDLVGRNEAAAGADSTLLASLYADLIAPAQRGGFLAGVRRLIIIPHSSLAYLPFAALRSARTGRYLMEDYSLLHLPSAAALGVIRARPSIASPANVRVTAFAPFARELPGSAREARAVANATTGAIEVTGTHSTERRVREALVGGGIVHVATHGIMNARNPMFSRVEMARGSGSGDDDGRLEVHEVLALRIRASLVFLSGCETGLGGAWNTQFATGEDYSTLSQAFLYAGANTVAGTLWRIGDAGGAVFASHFYRQLGSASPADALVAAQREMVRNRRFSRPYYWAGYQVSGANEIVNRAHNRRHVSVSP